MHITRLNLQTNSGLFPSKVLITGTDAGDSSILIWNMDQKKPMKRLNGHTNRINEIVSFQDEATICTSSDDGNIAVWDLMNDFACIQVL